MTLVYLFMALAPALALSLYIYWKDREETDPPAKLVSSLAQQTGWFAKALEP